MHLSVSENKYEKDTSGTEAMLLFSGTLAFFENSTTILSLEPIQFVTLCQVISIWCLWAQRAKKEGGQWKREGG